MPPKNKAVKTNKKGKAPKKRAPPAAPVPSNSDWTSSDEEEEASVKRILSSMTTVMAALTTQIDDLDGGRKRWKVAFQGDLPAPCVAVPDAVSGAHHGPPAPSTSRERLETAPTGSLPPHLPSTSQERLTTAPMGSLPPRLPSTSQERMETAPTGSLPPHLPDVSDAVRARVAQRLQGAPPTRIRTPPLSRGGGATLSQVKPGQGISMCFIESDGPMKLSFIAGTSSRV